jgi:TANFOR domain-containing protein
MKKKLTDTQFKYILILIVALLSIRGQAQINVSVNVLPPYDPNLFTYAESEGRVLITLTNTSTQTHEVKLQGSFKSIDESISVSTDANYQPAAPITLGPGESQMLAAGQFRELFPSESAIEVVGIERSELLRTRRLPGGIYRLCVRAYDFNEQGQRTPLSGEEPFGCSVTFMIATINPPEIIQFGAVSCGETLIPTDLPNFQLQWLAPPQAPINAVYEIEMVEVINSEYSAFDAFESATTPLFFEEDVTAITSFLYNSSHPPLVEGYSYAIRVRITDPTGSTRFANRGLSEPCMFKYGEGTATGSAITLTPAYPSLEEYIPFDNFPVMVHFAPYQDDYYRMTIGNEMTINGLSVGSGSDEIRWPWGPSESQTREVGFPISESEAAYIAINRSNPTPEGNYEKGATYIQNISAQFLSRSSSEAFGASCRFEYTAGMGVPRCQNPPNGGTVSPGSIDFRFLTAEKPTNPLPSFDIVRRRAGGEDYEGVGEHGITDAYQILISKSENMSSPIVDSTVRFSPDVTLLQCMDNPSLLDDSVYVNKTNRFSIADTGTYYWQINWLGVDSRGRIKSGAYASSEVQRFVISNESEVETDTTRSTPEDCLAECRAPAITDNNAVNTVAVGDVVKVGLFDATITVLSYSGNRASGEGHIDVPVMNAPLKVKFSGVEFNAGKKLIRGEMMAVSDLTDLVPQGLAEQFGGAFDMSESTSQELEAAINSGGRLVSQLTGSEPMGLPLGLDNQIDGNQYTVGIVGCKFTQEMARLNAVISLGIPQLHGFLSLQASGVPFHPNGIDASEAMLSIPIDKTLEVSDDISFTLKAPNLPSDSGTYVSWDCDGFKELVISGTVDFSREIAVPDTEDGTPGTGTVQGRFKTKISNLNGWMCSIDMDNFQPTSAPGWGVHVETAVLDYSDASNATGMEFPEYYVGDKTALWHGFYLKRAALVFPKEFEKFGSDDTRLTAAIEGLMIDRTGLTVSLQLQNIFSVGEGNLDDWGYSLDSLYFSLANSEFREAGFGGVIKLPISENDTLKYNAALSRSTGGDFAFEFRIQPADTIGIDIWEAKLNLFPTSRVNIVVDGSGFVAGADLSGYLSLVGDAAPPSGSSGSSFGGMSMRGIEFQNLVIKTRGPDYITCGHWRFASDQHSGGGFPLSIRDINLVNRSGPSMMEFDQSPGARVGIQFSLDLNLTGETNTFSASTQIALLGKLNLGDEEAQLWSFSGVNLDSIAISGKVGVVELEGSLVFYNSHATYGTGIKGAIRATFEPTITVQAAVQFGSVDDYRYWYVDAQAVWSPGVTLFAGVDLRGIGGGAWYHMRKPDPVPYSSIVGTSMPSDEVPGATMTGSVFTPDRAVGLGFEARLLVGATGGSTAYHGMIALGAQFTASTGGIERIYLEGDFIIMSQTDDRSEAVASADFLVNYNFPEKRFLANFNVYVNVYDVLVGVNDNNLAGSLEILSEPGNWHIFVGQPETPVGLRLQIGEVELARVQFYFMVGMSLPPMPPLPEEISSRLHVSNERSHLVLSGDGFAMGAFLNFDMSFRMMPFYMDMAFGLGFDLSVLKVSEGCNGMTASEVGADGWYAQGQIYGYLDFSTGLYVDLWFVSGEFEILGLEVAAYLQGGFPNPSWAKGEIGGAYRILGGIISGDFHYAFEAGTPCEPLVAPPENPLAGLTIITDMYPRDNERNVDVGVEPSATYLYSMDKEFSLTVKDHLNNATVRTFMVREKDIALKENGVQEVEGNFRDENEKKVSVFTSFELLESRTNYTWTTTAVAYEKLVVGVYNPEQVLFSSGGIKLTRSEVEDLMGRSGDPEQVLLTSMSGDVSLTRSDLEALNRRPNEPVEPRRTEWGISRKNNGDPIDTTATVRFTTGPRPGFIRDRDVAFTYPYRNQRYFLQEECRVGVLALKRTMGYLFAQENTDPDYIWMYQARLIPMNGQPPVWVDLINTSSNYIQFDMPPLINEMVYRVDFVARRVQTAAAQARANVLRLGLTTLQRPVSTMRENITTYNIGSSTVSLRTEVYIPPANTRTDDFKVMYSYHFKTSKHNSIRDKIAARDRSPVAEKKVTGRLERISVAISGLEPLDVYDTRSRDVSISGRTRTLRPLVSWSSYWDSGSNYWMRENNDIIYSFRNYLLNRDLLNASNFRWNLTLYGTPPVDAVALESRYIPKQPLSTREKQGMSIVNASSSGTSSYAASPPFGFGGSMFRIPPPDNNVYITYNVPIMVFLNGSEVRQMAYRVLRTYGGINSEILTGQDKQYIRKAINRSYTYVPLIPRETYRIKVKYQVPYCFGDPDGGASTTSFNFYLP